MLIFMLSIFLMIIAAIVFLYTIIRIIKNPMADISENFVRENLSKDEIRVLEAVEDEKWDFRSVDGISRETQIPPSTVKEILESHKNLFRKSDAPDRKGRILYTIRSRPVKSRERLAFIRLIFSKKLN